MVEPVKLYVYDLSQGLARTMSLQLTGKQIDGIWHTSVVVYGKEYFFSQGIMIAVPGSTHHGQPLQVIDIGETHLPEEVVTDYINSLRSVYTAEKYHLLDFNCNTFSNDVCQFLCGQSIPSHITSLPSEFLNTPFGQSMLPMIENMFGQSRLSTNSRPAQQQAPVMPPAAAAALFQNVSSAATSAAPASVDPIQIATSASTVDQLIATYKAVVVFFTSATCPPCQAIKPSFEQLIRDKNPHPAQHIQLLGVVMDTAMGSGKYSITATPTFQFFLNGKKYSEFKGANYAELKSQVDILLFEAYPPHPHRKVLLRSIVDQPNVPILYNQPGKWDMIYSKLDGFLDRIELGDQQKQILKQSRVFLEDTSNQTFDMKEWKKLIETNRQLSKTPLDVLLDKLPADQLFPVLDIYRSLLVRQTVSDFFVHDPSQLVRLMTMVNSPLPKATWLMILRTACNIFSNTTLATTHFTSNLPTSHRAELTQLVITSLLAEDAQVRQTAASLAYNCSTGVASERLQKEQSTFAGMAEQEDDDWQVELSSAILDALSKEEDEEIIHRLLATIAKFLFLAPEHTSSVADLLSALDIQTILEDKKKLLTSTKALGLVRDTIELVKLSA
ncbi:PPPDE putative peptidase domain-containing protein [Choanephora cucurbitarum]|nr:PPPDE putative peptidase domain-containing protein [Choanephora cucurbitarum]